jgi:hypothetical protein
VLEAAPGATGAAVFGADPWGIPSIYPSALISIGLLIVVSLMTPPPRKEELARLFPESTGAAT